MEDTKSDKENICQNCKTKVKGNLHKITDNKKYLDVCEKCRDSIMGEVEAQSKNVKYFPAILLGVVLGLVGAVLWFLSVIITKYELGIVALGVGFLVGYGISKGAGKKKSRNLQIISAIIALISILIGEYLITNHYAYQYLIQGGYAVKSYFLNPVAVIKVTIDSIKSDPLTLLFWGIAVWFAYTIPKPKKLWEIK